MVSAADYAAYKATVAQVASDTAVLATDTGVETMDASDIAAALTGPVAFLNVDTNGSPVSVDILTPAPPTFTVQTIPLLA